MKQEPSDREPRACMAYYAWILALSCGLAVGIGIGAAIGSIGAGVGIGVGAGVAVGLVLYRWSKSDSGDGWYRNGGAIALVGRVEHEGSSEDALRNRLLQPLD